MIYLQLFLSFFQIGLFSFGGGYASLPLIRQQVTALHHWMTMPEFTDLITISQMTPGPISVNAATFVGIRTAGLPGAVAATAGCVFPSCVLIFFLTSLYLRYQNASLLEDTLTALRPAVVAMIAAAGLSLLVPALFHGGVEMSSVSDGAKAIVSAARWDMAGIFLVSLFLLRRTKLSPVAVMLLAGAAKLLLTLP